MNNVLILTVLIVLLRNATCVLSDTIAKVQNVSNALIIVWYVVIIQLAKCVILLIPTRTIRAFLVEEVQALLSTLMAISLLVSLDVKHVNMLHNNFISVLWSLQVMPFPMEKSSNVIQIAILAAKSLKVVSAALKDIP